MQLTESPASVRDLRAPQAGTGSNGSQAWVPPALDGRFESAIGSSVVEAFVVDHSASDVLLDQLLAQCLSEVLGATTVEEKRILANTIFPLVMCQSTPEMATCLRRQGINWRHVSEILEEDMADEDEEDGNDPQARGADALNRVKNQLLSSLSNGLNAGAGGVGSQSAQAQGQVQLRSRQKLELPPLDKVSLTALEGATSWTPPVRGSGGGGGSGGWSPPGPADVERDQLVGDRGEEVVYRHELDRLRALGYERPEDHVIWISRTNPGADHDIQSVAEDGRPLWIEVKSTMLTDGRFDWPKNEFEKALREGDHYELWRVYEAHTTHPTAKRFRDPIGLIRAPTRAAWS